MTDFLLSHFGYLGLFAISFCAATLIPLGSEAAVVVMALGGFHPGVVFLVATTGNSLGAFANYFVGKWGGRHILSRYIHPGSPALARAESTYARWGAPSLFFAWAPIVGDPLTVAAGVLRVRLAVFAFWVVLGKALRYGLILRGLDMATG